MLDIKDLHEKILYPTVQVRTEKAGGSGTVIASVEVDGEFRSYILTNYHVIAGAIDYKDKWDGYIGRDVKTEIRSPVQLGFYTYRRTSWLDSMDHKQADVVAHDETEDLALIEMLSGKPPDYIAKLLPKLEARGLLMGLPLIACGCSLLHKPLWSPAGVITSLDERIDNVSFWMSNTSIIFGNSGGGMFLSNSGRFVGVPSRIDVTSIGFSPNAMPFLNYFIPITRVYEFLDFWQYQFVYDPEQDYHECVQRRRDRQDELQQVWEEKWKKARRNVVGGGLSDNEPTEETHSVTDEYLKSLRNYRRPSGTD